jgi:hypothetical protein
VTLGFAEKQQRHDSTGAPFARESGSPLIDEEPNQYGYILNEDRPGNCVNEDRPRELRRCRRGLEPHLRIIDSLHESSSAFFRTSASRAAPTAPRKHSAAPRKTTTRLVVLAHALPVRVRTAAVLRPELAVTQGVPLGFAELRGVLEVTALGAGKRRRASFAEGIVGSSPTPGFRSWSGITASSRPANDPECGCVRGMGPCARPSTSPRAVGSPSDSRLARRRREDDAREVTPIGLDAPTELVAGRDRLSPEYALGITPVAEAAGHSRVMPQGCGK